MDSNDKIAEQIKDEGCYLRVRVLEDGTIIALGELLFTRAIYMDCDRIGWGKRFCFENRALASAEFDALQSGDDTPTGFIANR